MWHLDEHGTLANRLAGTSQQTTLVRGDREKVGFADADRVLLESMPNVTLREVASVGHFAMLDQPAAMAQLTAELATSIDDQ